MTCSRHEASARRMGAPKMLQRVPRSPRARLFSATLVLAAALLIGAAPALARVIHNVEGSFTGADAPGGPFVISLPGVAVDQTSGDVYTLETALFPGFGQNLVDKFEADGSYAGVQITGADSFAGAFAFTPLNSAVAVDNSSANPGDVYIADGEHGVVDRYSEAGTFVCQVSGKLPVSAEEKVAECNGAAGSATPAGSIAPTGVAVDGAGNLYIADPAHEVIDKFGPAGEFLGPPIADSHLSAAMATIAVDGAGNLYVTNRESNVVKFDAAGAFVAEIDSGGSLGVAVDPNDDHVYVGRQGEIREYEPDGSLIDSTSAPGVNSGLALAPSGRIYASPFIEGAAQAAVSIFGPAIAVPTVSTEAASGITETGATLNGAVDPDLAHGGLGVSECKFEYVEAAKYKPAEPNPYAEGPAPPACVPATPIEAASTVSANVPLNPSTTYHFRLEAANTNGAEFGADETFTTPGPPAIDNQSARANAKSAKLVAQINPFGFETSCRVEYVTDVEFAASGYSQAHTQVCAPANLTASFGEQTVTTALAGLQIGTTYHYRFIVSSVGGTISGSDQEFSTFGVKSFSFEAVDEEGHPYTQAGGHPYELKTSFELPVTHTGLNEEGSEELKGVVANLKSAQADLPPGLNGDPSATTKCTRADLAYSRCSGAAQVGVLRAEDISEDHFVSGLYNLAPPHGIAAEFGARIHGDVNVYLDAKTRTGGDYGITTESPNNSTAVGLTGVSLDLWGVPADPSHDVARRCPDPDRLQEIGPCPANASRKPFLSNPTSCSGPLKTTLFVDSWQAPGEFVKAEAEMPPVTGCNKVDFEPTIEARPTTSVSDSPSGLHVDIHVPQNNDPDGRSTANLKDTEVVLPKGLVVNPSAANGLVGCASPQLNLHGADPANCPAAAKIGTVEVDTPLLDHPLPGAVYIAKPHDNPFNSLLAIYIAVNDPESGVVLKLAGHVEANPETGQLTTTFEESPQLPFEDFKLDFFKGAHATLRTPPTCDANPSTLQLDPYTTTSLLTPWSAPESGPPAMPSDPWAISAAPGGGKCPAAANEEPNAPNFEAGTETPAAGAYSPFVLHLARPDGSQELQGIDATLPAGLIGKLAGVAECSAGALASAQGKTGAQEQAAPSCPSSSQVGTVTVGAGAGPAPYYVPGTAYLAGPYKGAPLSLAIITPAVAGPFDLGAVVVRTALYVDPETTQITAKSDPLPTILQGIPLDLRSITLNMSRPDFTLNPTSCEKKQVTASALSVLGQSAALSSPFQVGGCKALGFKPKLSINLKGGTKRTKHPALTATVTYPKGAYANIAAAQVTLPHSEFLDQSHIGTVCTRVQFAAKACPAASIYGYATAVTPLLDQPLSGPVYLRSSTHKLPDLVADLNGQIEVALAGRVDTGKGGGIRNTFELVPDAPVSKFVLSMRGGKKGLLVNSENICSKPQKALAHFVAQNGSVDNFSPLIANSCKGKAKKKGKGHKGHGKH